MLLNNIGHILKSFLPTRGSGSGKVSVEQSVASLKSIGFDDFLAIDMPPREMLLDPILPEKSLATLYAPRGIGKTLLALSIGLAVASGCPLLRWRAPRQRRVLYVDGEMPLVSLQERLRAISSGLGAVIPNEGFRVLAADSTESGISIGSEDGQRALDPLLRDVDLVIVDNLSTLCTNGSESASDAWVPMQNWLLKLRRQGIAVLLVHHAGTNGRQRGTSRREDALDTVIALRLPEDYSPEQGARFKVHFEKLRNRVDGDGALPFEAKLESFVTDQGEGVRWSSRERSPPVLKQVAELFQDGLTVREVAAALKMSKTEAGRLRLRAVGEGLFAAGRGSEQLGTNGQPAICPPSGVQIPNLQDVHRKGCTPNGGQIWKPFDTASPVPDSVPCPNPRHLVPSYFGA
jgi:putative DNA primase/helicase